MPPRCDFTAGRSAFARLTAIQSEPDVVDARGRTISRGKGEAKAARTPAARAPTACDA